MSPFEEWGFDPAIGSFSCFSSLGAFSRTRSNEAGEAAAMAREARIGTFDELVTDSEPALAETARQLRALVYDPIPTRWRWCGWAMARPPSVWVPRR